MNSDSLDDRYPMQHVADAWTDKWLTLGGPSQIHGRRHRLALAEAYVAEYAELDESCTDWIIVGSCGWGEVLEVLQAQGCKTFGVQVMPKDGQLTTLMSMQFDRQRVNCFFTAGVDFFKTSGQAPFRCSRILLPGVREFLAAHVETETHWRLSDAQCRRDVIG